MKTLHYPYVLHPREVTEEWMQSAIDWLFENTPVTDFEVGYDTQYDRTVDENGVPGEYVQVYTMWEEL